MRKALLFVFGVLVGLAAIPLGKIVFMVGFAYESPRCLDRVCVGEDVGALVDVGSMFGEAGHLSAVLCEPQTGADGGSARYIWPGELIFGAECETAIRAVIFRTDLVHTVFRVRNGKIVAIDREGLIAAP